MNKKRVVRSVKKLRRIELDEVRAREAAAVITPIALDEFEAGRYLGSVSVSTLRTWRVRGGGPKFYYAGAKLVRYPVTELDEFLKKRGLRETTSTPSPAA
jgi:hypothetical protein